MGFDFVFRRFLEFLHALAEALHELGNFLGPEQDDHDDGENNDFSRANQTEKRGIHKHVTKGNLGVEMRPVKRQSHSMALNLVNGLGI